MSFANPHSILFDTKGVELAVSNSQQLATSLSGSDAAVGVLMAGSGSDGKVRFWKAASDGTMFVTGNLSLNSNAGTTIGTVDQGDAGTIGQSWYVSITDGTQVIGDSSSTPIYITGTVDTQGPDGTAGDPVHVTGTLTAQLDGAVDQGNHGTADQSWYTVITDGTSSTALGTSTSSPLYVTGTFNQEGPDGTAGDPVYVTGSVALLEEPIEVSGTISLSPEANASASVSLVAASATSVTLLAANADRRGATFFYEGNKNLYLKLGTPASTTSYTVRMGNAGYYEVPAFYTGIVTGIWDKTGGSDNNVLVTEIVDV